MAGYSPFELDLSSLDFNASLNSGDLVIDAEHVHLLASAKTLLSAASHGKPVREIQTLLDTLIRDMALHFAHEDRLMSKSGWSEAEHHAGIHRLLMSEAERLAEQHRSSLVSFLDIYRFIIGSLVRDHLAIHDVEFHHFLQEDQE